MFGSLHSSCYDALYGALDYDGYHATIAKHIAKPKSDILDIGCGTGEFTRRLTAAGHRVVGIDPSIDMLDIARGKCHGTAATYVMSTAIAYRFDERMFDAAIMTGAVLGYQETVSGAMAALDNVHRHLRHGAVLIIDVWNALAVRAQGLRDRDRLVGDNDDKIIRKVHGTIDNEDQQGIRDP